MENNEFEKAVRSFKRATVFTAVTMVCAALALSSATFAWFTSNGEVSTSRVAASTANTEARLLLSAEGGSSFNGSEETDIVQLNEADLEKLMPVSTDDLDNFVYKVGMESNSSYSLDTDEKKYYHGHVYVMAECEGVSSYTGMALYLDDVSQMVAPASGSLVANAGRLGLKLEGQDPVILYMSEEENDSSDQVSNTYLNGRKVSDGNVLHYSSSGVTAVEDPAVSMERFSVSGDSPEPFAIIELNKIYELDIYLYLEGCDPDCSDDIQKDGTDLYISLFGVLEE